jgi:hypothetical protein
VEREEGEESGGAMERDQGRRPCSGTVEMLAVVENARGGSRCGDFF